MPDNKVVKIYADGACRGNPGPGGWGAILIWGDRRMELSGGERHTTNNRMELMAAIRALETLKRPVEVEVYSDSIYLVRGMTDWIKNWIGKNWKRKGGNLKNIDLWQQLAELCAIHSVKWFWVQGHAGMELNERADWLATSAIPPDRK